jgi:hypothetical protein
VELTRRRDFTNASPDQLSYETRSRRSRPTICSVAPLIKRRCATLQIWVKTNNQLERTIFGVIHVIGNVIVIRRCFRGVIREFAQTLTHLSRSFSPARFPMSSISPVSRRTTLSLYGCSLNSMSPVKLTLQKQPNGGVDAAARIQSTIAGAIILRNTLPPLASNDLLGMPPSRKYRSFESRNDKRSGERKSHVHDRQDDFKAVRTANKTVNE